MAIAKRIFLFLALNFLVVLMVTLILDLLHIKPYLTSYGLDLYSLAIFCFLWGMGGALISLALSRAMAKWMLKVELIDPNTKDPELRHLVDAIKRLCRVAAIPIPQIGVYRSNEVNAFATGPTKNKALIAVSSGLLHRMKDEEMDGVIGHEISHIANGDMVTMTLLQGVVNAFVMFLARVLAYALSGLTKDRSRSGGGSYVSYMLFVYLFEIVFMILGSIVIAAYSRFREFRADRGGARLAGTHSMIAALKALQTFQETKDARSEKPALAAFKINHSGKKGFLALFASHPPLSERIARLEK